MPERRALRVYLDSNVLYSASRDEASRLREIWALENVVVVASRYAVGEVLRNIDSTGHRARFDDLMRQTDMVSDAATHIIPEWVELAPKDKPVLAAAIAASADYLLTGDQNHFAHLYGKRIAGVEVTRPAAFLDKYRDSFGA